MVVHPLSRAQEVLRFYREYSRATPDELTAFAALVTTPEGLPAIAIALCYCGPLEEGERLVEPVRKFGSPLADLIGPMAYCNLNSMVDAAFPAGRCCYEKASRLKELSDEAIETIADYGAAFTSPFSRVVIQHIHGAASRVGPTETAFVQREESYVMDIIALWDKGEAHTYRMGPHILDRGGTVCDQGGLCQLLGPRRGRADTSFVRGQLRAVGDPQEHV